MYFEFCVCVCVCVSMRLSLYLFICAQACYIKLTEWLLRAMQKAYNYFVDIIIPNIILSHALYSPTPKLSSVIAYTV